MKPENVSVIDNFVEELQRTHAKLQRTERRLSEEEYNAKVLREERDKLLAEQSALRARVAEVERERDEARADTHLVERYEALRAEFARVLEQRHLAREALRVARHALEQVESNLAETRWTPDGGVAAWGWSIEGRSHARVMRSLEVARAALAATKGDE